MSKFYLSNRDKHFSMNENFVELTPELQLYRPDDGLTVFIEQRSSMLVKRENCGVISWNESEGRYEFTARKGVLKEAEETEVNAILGQINTVSLQGKNESVEEFFNEKAEDPVATLEEALKTLKQIAVYLKEKYQKPDTLKNIMSEENKQDFSQFLELGQKIKLFANEEEAKGKYLSLWEMRISANLKVIHDDDKLEPNEKAYLKDVSALVYEIDPAYEQWNKLKSQIKGERQEIPDGEIQKKKWSGWTTKLPGSAAKEMKKIVDSKEMSPPEKLAQVKQLAEGAEARRTGRFGWFHGGSASKSYYSGIKTAAESSDGNKGSPDRTQGGPKGSQ